MRTPKTIVYSENDHEDLKRLIKSLHTGEVELSMLRAGERLPTTDHDQLVRHLIHLDYHLVKGKSAATAPAARKGSRVTRARS